jgi:alpha-D-xyloside xylohydrolase
VSAFNPVHSGWLSLPLLQATTAPAHSRHGKVELETTAGPLVVSLHPFGVRLRFGGERPIDYGLVTEVDKADVVSVKKDANKIIIESATHSVAIDPQSLAIEVAKSGTVKIRSARDGHFVREYRLAPISRTDRGWVAHFDLTSEDHIYGLGEKWSKLDKRGQYIHSYNHDALGVNAEASYKNSPFAWSTRGWGVFANTPSPVQHGVGFSPWSQRAYGVYVEDDYLDLFLFTEDTGAAILRDYTALTGRAPMPPDWTLGLIMSKAYYQDEEELLTVAAEIRRRGLPCDTITLDGRAWLDVQTRFSFEWDTSRYPDPAQTLKKLKDMNFKVCVWEFPLISTQNPLFDELAEKGWLLKDAPTGQTHIYQWDPEPFSDVLTPLPDSGILDFTHPDAYAFWRDSHKKLFDVGVDMIKADFGEQVTDEVIAHNGESGRALHNVYSYLYNKCVYEAAEKYAENGPFLFSRSSWTGCQRFPSQWGGDPQADWEGLAASLRGGLSWGLSGGPFYATDIGGFYGDQRDPKLYVRWLQMAIFSAHVRMHGIGPREPWSYGPAAEAAAMEAVRLRYRLLPYVKRTVKAASQTGLPVQRAMALACPKEPEAWHFDQQFFFGDDLLVAPCVRDDDAVRVYVPEGRWRRFPDNQPIDGGKIHNLRLGLSEVAVFAREGAEVPLAVSTHYVEQIDALQIERVWRAGD